MSGGSYNYIYSQVQNECVGGMYDKEMDDMMSDLVEVLHDLEWWKSSDSREEDYRKTLSNFKSKWFVMPRGERLKEYIDCSVEKLRGELIQMVGEVNKH